MISVKGALALGKIFEEVYQELGKDKNSNEGEGIYLEWLKTNNYSRVTWLGDTDKSIIFI